MGRGNRSNTNMKQALFTPRIIVEPQDRRHVPQWSIFARQALTGGKLEPEIRTDNQRQTYTHEQIRTYDPTVAQRFIDWNGKNITGTDNAVMVGYELLNMLGQQETLWPNQRPFNIHPGQADVLRPDERPLTIWAKSVLFDEHNLGAKPGSIAAYYYRTGHEEARHLGTFWMPDGDHVGWTPDPRNPSIGFKWDGTQNIDEMDQARVQQLRELKSYETDFADMVKTMTLRLQEQVNCVDDKFFKRMYF